ncbi:MAG TPA: PH domain-containing protein [Chitinophagaceae bacterium]
MNRLQTDWSVPQRQAPAALFILLYKTVLRILKIFWPFLLFYFFKNQTNEFDRFEFIIIALSVISLLGSVVEFIYFRFFISQNDLIIKSGFFTKKTINLPLDKIQGVHIEQTWLHSLFNVARVSFDSAGSEKVEVKIDAINKAEAEDFKRFILHARPEAGMAVAAPEPEKPIVHLNSKDLFKLSISANHLEAFLLMLAFFLSAIDQLKDIFNLEYNRFVNWVYGFNNSPAAALLAGAIAALMVSVVISTVRVIFRYFDFRISTSAKGFLIHSGLINIQEKLVPFNKIQYISWKANWIRERMRLYLLHFHAIGSQEINDKLRVKVPVTRDNMIPVLLEHYHPLLPKETITPLRIHPAYIIRKILVTGLLPVALLAIPGFYFFQWAAFWLAGWLILISISSILFQRKFRLWTDERALQIRRGFLGMEELILRWDKIQSVSLQQSIYQEGKELATVNLFTAGGTVSIPYIRLNDAREIVNYAMYKVSSSLHVQQNLPGFTHLTAIE